MHRRENKNPKETLVASVVASSYSAGSPLFLQECLLGISHPRHVHLVALLGPPRRRGGHLLLPQRHHLELGVPLREEALRDLTPSVAERRGA